MTEFPVKLIQFSSFNRMSWYVGYYFIVIVIAKIFLNDFLGKLDQKNNMMFIVVLFALIQFSWSKGVISNIGGGLETVCTGVFLYFLGGYIKEYDPFASIRSWAVIAIIIVINLIVIGDFYISTIGNIQAYNSDGGNMFIQAIPVYQNSQIVPVILEIAVFELFRRLNVPNIRVVNFIGASTFMIYLIHDNEFVYKIWDTQDWLTLLHEDVIRFFGIYFVWTLKTFAAGFICYCIFVMGGKLVNIFKPLVIKQTM